MALLNKTGITNGGTIQSEHVTRTIDALTGVSTDTIVATGSFTGSFKGSLTGTASFAATASYALNAGTGGGEYMTLRLSSGLITGLTSGSTVYIGTDVTSSAIARAGIMLPYNCSIVSASVYANTTALFNDALADVALNYDITGTPSVLTTFADLDTKTRYLDANSVSVAYDSALSNRWINVKFTPQSTGTGQCVVSADILIKKS
jgi:hypothetical protein